MGSPGMRPRYHPLQLLLTARIIAVLSQWKLLRGPLDCVHLGLCGAFLVQNCKLLLLSWWVLQEAAERGIDDVDSSNDDHEPREADDRYNNTPGRWANSKAHTKSHISDGIDTPIHRGMA